MEKRRGVILSGSTTNQQESFNLKDSKTSRNSSDELIDSAVGKPVLKPTKKSSKKVSAKKNSDLSPKTRKKGVYGFIGLDVGIGSLNKNYFNDGFYSTKSDITALPAIMGGVIYYVNNYFGMRFYVDLMYGQYSHDSLYGGIYNWWYDSKLKTNLLSLGLNYDLLFRFFSSEIIDLGAYLGIANSVGIWFGGNSTLDLGVDVLYKIRLGLNMEIVDHHTIELGATIPLFSLYVDTNYYTSSGSLYETNAFKQGVMFNIRYLYRF